MTVNNDKQTILNGFDGLQQNYILSDLIQDLVSKHGLATLAEELGIDKSALSRYKNGEGALSLESMDRIMAHSDMIIINRKRYKRLFYTILTLSEFLKEALGW